MHSPPSVLALFSRHLQIGINWNLSTQGALRIGFAAGLEDGAPDTQALVGYSFDF